MHQPPLTFDLQDRPKALRSPHWPATRRAHLKQFGKCAVCGSSADLEVHHVKPVHVFPELELEPSNLVTLCEAPGGNHHFWFGHLGSWHSWNTTVRKDADRFYARVLTRPGKVESQESRVEGQKPEPPAISTEPRA